MAAGNGSRILICDDEPRVLQLLGQILRSEGYEVVEAPTGRDAIDRAGEILPDLLLLDMYLPDMRGIDVLRRFKANPSTAEIPIILATGQPATDDLIACFDGGADEYLTKPFLPTELLARIRSVLRLAETRRALAEANAQLEDIVTQKAGRLEALYHYSRRLDEAKTQDEILDLVMTAVEQGTAAQRVSIFMPCEDGQLLQCVRSLGIDPDIVANLRIDASDGVAGRVFVTGRTIVANDPAQLHRPDDRYQTNVFLSMPIISRPLTSHGEVLGVLNVTDRKGDRPFTPEEVECVTSIANMAAVALHNEMHRTRLEEFVQGLLLTVGRLAEFRDDETATHLERVQRYVEILAKQMRKSPKFSAMIDDLFIRHLVACSPMHDIGKVGIPDGILLKPGPLTTDEYEIMQRHVEIGRETVSFAMQRTGPNPLLNMCLDVIAGHHEAWDGTGYPRGRIGEAIPLAARIVALADAYDAITSRRPYKEPRSHEEAEKIVRRESGFQFDPDVVEAFLARIDDFRRIQAEAHGIQENVAPQVAVPV